MSVRGKRKRRQRFSETEIKRRPDREQMFSELWKDREFAGDGEVKVLKKERKGNTERRKGEYECRD